MTRKRRKTFEQKTEGWIIKRAFETEETIRIEEELIDPHNLYDPLTQFVIAQIRLLREQSARLEKRVDVRAHGLERTTGGKREMKVQVELENETRQVLIDVLGGRIKRPILFVVAEDGEFIGFRILENEVTK